MYFFPIIHGCWTLSYAFSELIERIICYFSFIFLLLIMWWLLLNAMINIMNYYLRAEIWLLLYKIPCTYSIEGRKKGTQNLGLNTTISLNLSREDTLNKVKLGMPNAFLSSPVNSKIFEYTNHTHASLCLKVMLIPGIK